MDFENSEEIFDTDLMSDEEIDELIEYLIGLRQAHENKKLSEIGDASVVSIHQYTRLIKVTNK